MDLHACHAVIQLLQTQRQQLLDAQHQNTRLIEGLQHQLRQLLQRVYGRSAEKLDPNQLALFEKMIAELGAIPQATVPEPTPTLCAPATATSTLSDNGHGRRRLPADLPRWNASPWSTICPEADKPCPCCGHAMRLPDRTRRLRRSFDFVPATLRVIQDVRLDRYICKACEQSAPQKLGRRSFWQTNPCRPSKKAWQRPGLLALDVIVSKYGDHLPLHRLERILERHGIDIARSTMCDWMAGCAAALQPLYQLMVKEVLASHIHGNSYG